MKKKLLATIVAVCLSLTACNSTEQTKDVQANEKKDKNTEQQTATTSPKAKEIKEKVQWRDYHKIIVFR